MKIWCFKKSMIFIKKSTLFICACSTNSFISSIKSLKSAIRTHSQDSKLVRQVYIVQKMSPRDMINHKRTLRVRFFLHHPLCILILKENQTYTMLRCTDFAKNKTKSCSEQRNRPAKISSKFMNILKMLIFSMLLHKKRRVYIVLIF